MPHSRSVSIHRGSFGLAWKLHISPHIHKPTPLRGCLFRENGDQKPDVGPRRETDRDSDSGSRSAMDGQNQPQAESGLWQGNAKLYSAVERVQYASPTINAVVHELRYTNPTHRGKNVDCLRLASC